MDIFFRKIAALAIAAFFMVSAAYAEDEGGLPPFPVYGNWCGAGHPPDVNSTLPTRDAVDAACRNHDLCYASKSKNSRISVLNGYCDAGCDQKLIEELDAVVSSDLPLKPEAFATGRAAVEYFKKTPCKVGTTEENLDRLQKLLKRVGAKIDRRCPDEVRGGKGGLSYSASSPTNSRASCEAASADDLVFSVSDTVSVNRWLIGFDNKSAHPGVSFSTDDFFAQTFEGSVALKNSPHKPFFQISYLLPFDGKHRQDIALAQSAQSVKDGYDRLRVGLDIGGIFAGRLSEYSPLPRGLGSFLSDANIEYSVTHGFGQGKAVANVVFVQPGATINNRTISGNLEEIANGQSVTFHTVFKNWDVSSDAYLLLGEGKRNSSGDFEQKWPVIGAFSHEYRRPTDQSEDIADYFSCPTCTAGYAWFLFDTDYSAKGLSLGYEAQWLRPKTGSGWFGNAKFRYGYGLSNSVTLHDSSIDLFGGKDVHYDWAKVGGEVGRIYHYDTCDVCSLEIVGGVGVERNSWSTSIVPLFDRSLNDLDRLLSAYVRVAVKF